jgi:hypothetical protein
MGFRTGLDMFEKRKICCPLPGFEHRIVQPVTSCYTNYVILAPIGNMVVIKFDPIVKPSASVTFVFQSSL